MGDYKPETTTPDPQPGATKQAHDISQNQSGVLYHQLRRQPLNIVGGRGSYLLTEDGLEILDATSGAAVSCLGHSDKRVHAAIQEQLQRIPYCYSMFFTNSAAEDLSRFLVDSTGGKMSRAYIVSSGKAEQDSSDVIERSEDQLLTRHVYEGTEAVEASLKMAVQYFMELPNPQPQRVNFIARKQSYHGNTLGSLSLGHHVGRRALYEKVLAKNTHHVSQCYPYRGMKPGVTVESYVERLAQELEDEFQRLGPDTVCAFVAETMAGAVSPENLNCFDA